MTDDTFWIGTSWKMNKTRGQSRLFAQRLSDTDNERSPRIQRFVIPPFTALCDTVDVLSDSSVKIGAQNMHWADSGAWTGEVSPLMLRDVGLHMVELGHSERRAHFGESDETVGLKTEAAVRHGLIPLICIGETLAERDAGCATSVLETQVRYALSHLSDDQLAANILFAYEPVWAIGDGGTPASADYANARHAEIKALTEVISGRRMPCLYGGSVNAGNCVELIQCEHIDGLFIGRSAWDVDGYLGILERCANTL